MKLKVGFVMKLLFVVYLFNARNCNELELEAIPLLTALLLGRVRSLHPINDYFLLAPNVDTLGYVYLN